MLGSLTALQLRCSCSVPKSLFKIFNKNTYTMHLMPPHVFLCAYYNNKAFKNAKNKETK